jgi:hypothetical protein
MPNRPPRPPRSLLVGFAFLLCVGLGVSACGGGGGGATPSTIPTANPVVSGLPNQVGVNVTSVNLGNSVVTAAKLRTPATGASHVGVVIIHPFSSYVDFEACNDLAARGFTTLCVDTIWTNNEFGYYGFEQHVPAIKAAVQYLRSRPNITKVVLLGHSMGGPMMAFYQNVAENGTGVCTGPEKIIPCVTTNLTSLPPADGLIIFDSHLGESLATYTYLDPSVINNTLGQRAPIHLDVPGCPGRPQRRRPHASAEPPIGRTYVDRRPDADGRRHPVLRRRRDRRAALAAQSAVDDVHPTADDSSLARWNAAHQSRVLRPAAVGER